MSDLATTQMDQEAAAGSFNAAAEAKRDEISANKESLATKSSQLDDKMSDLATTQMELTETTALLHDDRTYLKDLTEQCERKAREWDQRSQMRKDELTAIGTALEIIEGTVLTRESSTGAGGCGARGVLRLHGRDRRQLHRGLPRRLVCA